MDSLHSNLTYDINENDTLQIKYEQLRKWQPKTKFEMMQNNVNVKNQIEKQTTYVGSIPSTKEWTRCFIQLNSELSKQNYVKSLNSMDIFGEKREENQTKSLSPTKYHFEEVSDYTFKLSNGLKKVRFRLNSDFQE